MNHRYYTALARRGRGAGHGAAAGTTTAALRGDLRRARRRLHCRRRGCRSVELPRAAGIAVRPDGPGPGRRGDPVRAVGAADGKPLFGVCRGLQIMNVAAGGSLYQDCEEYYEGSIKHDYFPNAGYARDYLAHTVRVSGHAAARAFGADEVQVNSMHHQGLKRVAEGLVPTATAPDGLIEALEAPGRRRSRGRAVAPRDAGRHDAGTRGCSRRSSRRRAGGTGERWRDGRRSGLPIPAGDPTRRAADGRLPAAARRRAAARQPEQERIFRCSRRAHARSLWSPAVSTTQSRSSRLR
jgi:hypothetical protein